nr:hypothetical protein Itr_chr05CG23180 [Ipomoea trifida]
MSVPLVRPVRGSRTASAAVTLVLIHHDNGKSPENRSEYRREKQNYIVRDSAVVESRRTRGLLVSLVCLFAVTNDDEIL